MFYLHGPDRKTPYEQTLREVNKLYQEGRFDYFGLSNYMSWEVAEICEICHRNNWIKPTVYQGVYHALQRSIESELFPCLRNYGISLYAFQPLAGGFLTGRYVRHQTVFDPESRFGSNNGQAQVHKAKYWNDSYFESLELLKTAVEGHGLTLAEVALRWLKHHSELKKDLNDAIIVGASSAKQLENNLLDLEKGPLPDALVSVLDQAWSHCKGSAAAYYL
jgi:aflatoxin B1 aldehyde reductase